MYKNKKPYNRCGCKALLDVPGGIRTPDRRLRRPLLYPAELLRHDVVSYVFHRKDNTYYM